MAWICDFPTSFTWRPTNGRLIPKAHCNDNNEWHLISMCPHVSQLTKKYMSTNVCSRVLTWWFLTNTKSIPWTHLGLVLWKVLRRGPKSYIIDWKGKAYTVSIDRLQPAYTLSDFNQSCHDVSRSASPNNHSRLSAAQMSKVSPLIFSSNRCNSSLTSVDVIAVPTTSYTHSCCAQTRPSSSFERVVQTTAWPH